MRAFTTEAFLSSQLPASSVRLEEFTNPSPLSKTGTSSGGSEGLTRQSKNMAIMCPSFSGPINSVGTIRRVKLLAVIVDKSIIDPGAPGVPPLTSKVALDTLEAAQWIIL